MTGAGGFGKKALGANFITAAMANFCTDFHIDLQFSFKSCNACWMSCLISVRNEVLCNEFCFCIPSSCEKVLKAQRELFKLLVALQEWFGHMAQGDFGKNFQCQCSLAVCQKMSRSCGKIQAGCLFLLSETCRFHFF